MRRISALLLLIGFATSLSLPAQTRAVGDVGEIRVLAARRDCRGSPLAVTTTTSVSVTRADQTTLSLRQGTAARVLLGDGFHVPKLVDVQLWITDMGDGALILAPQLLCPVWDADTTIERFGDSKTGVYDLSREPGGLLQFRVTSGGAFIQWNTANPKLMVIAGGNPVLIKGTQLAVLSDSMGGALLYVREGVVTLVDAGDLAVNAGEIYELRPTLPPRKLGDNTSRLARLASNEVQFHQQVFAGVVRPNSMVRHSIWRTPWPYIAAAGVAGGATYCGALSDTRCGTRKKNHTATILVHVPL
jgi:hypothetical protein